jgi:Fe-S-cluster containining protein
MHAPADQAFIHIVDAAVAEAARRAGSWLACRPGCTQCCTGPFPITQLDAWRLGRGLAELEAREPERAARVRLRARQALVRYAPDFPGDPATGVLSGDEGARFWDETDNDPCPALDPSTGLCDLYLWRPVTCRAFGPATRMADESVGACELCFEGASDEEIAACAVEIDPEGLEAALAAKLEEATGARGETLIAFALAQPCPATTKSGS